MAIAVATTRQSVANAYTGLGAFIGICTADPGTSSTPANEATGGGYARLATTWTPGSGGAATGSVVALSVPAGTFTHVILCSAATGATMLDKYQLGTSVVMSVPGTINVNPSFTET